MIRGKVCFAFLVSDKDTATCFTLSLPDLVLYDVTHHQRMVAGGGYVPHYCAAETVAASRNELTARFLDESEAEFFCMIDSDMGFPADTIDRLVEVVDPIERPIVGALCFAQRIVGTDLETHVPIYRQIPTIYTWHESELGVGFQPIDEVPENALVRCNATGAACFVAHRHLLERLREKHGNTWWTKIPDPKGGHWGEDMSFCLRVNELGNAVHVHTGIQVAHQKPTHLSLETFRKEPAAPNVVVIPSKNGRLAADVVSGIISQGEATEIVVCDNGIGKSEDLDDVVEMNTNVTVINCEGQGIHEMWNAGWQYAKRQHGHCNVAFLNDDLEIGPNFLSGLAKELRADNTLMAVCPNYDGRDSRGVNVEYLQDICAGRYDGTGGFAGFAFMVRGEFPYLFPEECKWWWGDTDLVMTVMTRGYRVGMVLNTSVKHDEGITTGNWDDPDMKEQLAKDEAAFHAKWAA